MTDIASPLDIDDVSALIVDHFREQRDILILEDNFSEEFADKVVANCVELMLTFYISLNKLVFPIMYKENSGQVNLIFMEAEKYFQFEITADANPTMYLANILAGPNHDGKLAASGTRKTLVAFPHYMNRPDLAHQDKKLWIH